MRCVISVLGKDRSGIVAAISGVLAEKGANIADISQTILDDIFSMTMLGNWTLQLLISTKSKRRSLKLVKTWAFRLLSSAKKFSKQCIPFSVMFVVVSDARHYA